MFLLVWCKQKSDKRVKIVLLLLRCMTIMFRKYKTNPDFQNDVKTCIRSKFFASKFINICDDFQFLITRINSNFNSISKLKYRNLNSCFQSAILLSCDRGLNSGPTDQYKPRCFNESNVIKSRGLHFIHLNLKLRNSDHR